MGIRKGQAVRNVDSVAHSRNTSILGALYARTMVSSLVSRQSTQVRYDYAFAIIRDDNNRARL